MDKALIVILPFVLSLVLCRAAMWLNILDAPDGERKLQAVPVPRTGGIGLVFAFLMSAVGFLWLVGIRPDLLVQILSDNLLLGPTVFVIGLAIVGLLDDWIQLPALLKFVVIGGLAIIAAMFGPVPNDVFVPGAGEISLPEFVAIGGAALWLFVVANAVNFMDGANGLALGTSAVMLLAIALLLTPFAALSWEANYIFGQFAAVVMALSAIGGFLVWNLRGRLYAGDMGALFVGGLLGVFGLVIGQFFTIWLAPLILLPFLVDVLLTMLVRARAGEKLLQPHRSHAYQLLMRAGVAHARVAAMWWGFAALCGGVAILVVKGSIMAGRLDLMPDIALGAFLIMLLAATIVWFRQRRTLGARLEHDGL